MAQGPTYTHPTWGRTTIKVRVRTPARLHFSLLDMNGELGRVDGGIGASLEYPHFTITAEPSPHLRIMGHEASAAEAYAKRFLSNFRLPHTVAIEVHEAIPAHVGLGSRTQLSLGIATALARLFKVNASVGEMAAVMGRGGTSGIGLAAFEGGGFILDGGHTFGPSGVKQRFLPSDACAAPPPPLLMRHPLPEEWCFVIAVPRVAARIHGEDEKRLFTEDCPVSAAEVNALCRIVLMRLLPAVVERDIETFGQALTTIQEIGFKRLEIKRQHPIVADTVRFMLKHGALGVGMSSVGPGVYAITRSKNESETLTTRTREFLNSNKGGEVVLSKPQNTGARVEIFDS